MKTFLIALAATLLCSLPAGAASMSNYSGYWTVAGNGSQVYITGVVDGNGVNIPVLGVTHQGQCTVKIGTSSITVTGPRQAAASYMNVTCSQTLDVPVPVPDGWTVDAESTQHVTCSIAGTIFVLQEGPSAIGYRLSAYTIATTVGTCLYNRSCIGTCSDKQIQRGNGPLCAKFLQCIDIVYTCLCGGTTECIIKRLYCTKEDTVGTCTENRAPPAFSALDVLRL